MLSRLGFDFGGGDENNGFKGGVKGAAYSKWQQQQDEGLMENEAEAESVIDDAQPCGSFHGGCGDTRFQEELAQALSLAVRADTRLEINLATIMSRALKESREEQVMSVA